jgi:DMSO reductase family type II enzyme chaperone
LYQLLSQSLVYPSEEAVAMLKQTDLPQAQQMAGELRPPVALQLLALAEQLQCTDAAALQAEHRRIFSHILSLDCPPCESVYTTRDVFQQTQELSDIAGFFRAFGLELADRERPDHISVELEFMHFLTYKEAYAVIHHGPSKARLCREVQRKFMQDHLGRWAFQFAKRLREKAGEGYFGCVASLVEALLSAEIAFLRARPEAVVAGPDWRGLNPDDDSCPAAGECPMAEVGRDAAYPH